MDEDRGRHLWASPLGRKHRFDGNRVERVTTDAVHRVRGENDDLTGPDGIRGRGNRRGARLLRGGFNDGAHGDQAS